MTGKQIQCLLAYLAIKDNDSRYDPGTIDGVVGPKTNAAIAAFKADYGMGAEGLVAAVANTAVKIKKTSTSTPAVSDGIYGSKYFKREEFRCTCGRCGGFPVEPTKGLVAGCDQLRETAGVPLLIVDAGGSGVRCKTHNAEVNGAANSNHLYGKAADLHPTKGMTPRQLYNLADKQLGKTGELGIYSWGIHFAPEGNYSRFQG